MIPSTRPVEAGGPRPGAAGLRHQSLAQALAAPLEAGRLEAALSLTVTPIEPTRGRYGVTGGEQPHRVNLHAAEERLRCDCLDVLYRPGTVCKHQLAVLLFVGHPVIARALASRMAELRRQLKAATRKRPARTVAA